MPNCGPVFFCKDDIWLTWKRYSIHQVISWGSCVSNLLLYTVENHGYQNFIKIRRG